jgi:DNA repair exonuclease SbcCD ATPase subunit
MIIAWVKIEGFMRLRKAKVDFRGKDIIGIIAQNMENKKRANHQGKTSTIEAILWCLTGYSRATRDVDLISYGAEFCKVTTCLIDKDNNKHIITRGRDKKNTGSLICGTVDDMSAAQKAVYDILGMTESDFRTVFYFQQQEIHSFMLLAPDKKKAMLMEWLKNDHWKDKEAKVLKDIRDLKDQIKELQIDLSSKQKNLGDEQSLQDEYGLKTSKIDLLKKTRDGLSRKLTELRLKPNLSPEDVKQLQKKKHHAVSSLHDLGEEISDEQRLRDALKSFEDDLAVCPDWRDKLEKRKSKVSLLAQSLADSNSEMKIINQKLDTFRKHGKGVCPLIMEPCDRITPTPEKLEELRSLADTGDKAVVACHEAIKKNNLEIKKLEAYQVAENHIEKYKRRIAELETKKGEHERLVKEIKSFNEQLKSYNPDLTSQIEELEAEHSDVDDQIQTLSRGLGGLKSRLDAIEVVREESVQINEKLLSLTQDLNDLQYVSFMFGKKGIPSLEIENCFQEIEDNVNFILGQMNNEYTVSFKPDRELTAWEEHCVACGHTFAKGTKKPECPACGTERFKKRKDELRVVIVENDKEISFDMASGGLKTIVSLAVRAALSMLIRRHNNSNFSVLFLDEIDSALDEAYRETLMDLVSRVFVQKLGFDQIFWISHNKSISQSVPHTLLVKGYKDFSELEWV